MKTSEQIFLSVLLAMTLLAVTYSTVRAGTLVVVERKAMRVSLYDDATGKRLKSLDIAPGPNEVAVSGSGKRAAIAHYGRRSEGTQITIINIADGTIQKQIPLTPFSRPAGIVWPAGAHIFTVASAQGSLLDIWFRFNRVKRIANTWQQGSGPLTIGYRGKRAFIANTKGNSLTVINLRKGKKISDLSIGHAPGNLAAHPDGKELWVPLAQDNRIQIIDPRSLHPVAKLKAGRYPTRVQFTKNGRTAIVTNTLSGDIWLYDPINRTVKAKLKPNYKLKQSKGRYFSKSFAHSSAPNGIAVDDSNTVAFVSYSNADVVSIISLSANRIHKSFRTLAEPFGIAWSPVEVKLDP